MIVGMLLVRCTAMVCLAITPLPDFADNPFVPVRVDDARGLSSEVVPRPSFVAGSLSVTGSTICRVANHSDDDGRWHKIVNHTRKRTGSDNRSSPRPATELRHISFTQNPRT